MGSYVNRAHHGSLCTRKGYLFLSFAFIPAPDCPSVEEPPWNIYTQYIYWFNWPCCTTSAGSAANSCGADGQKSNIHRVKWSTSGRNWWGRIKLASSPIVKLPWKSSGPKKRKEKLFAAGVAFDQRVMGSSYIGTAHDAATFSLLFISRRQPPPPPSLPWVPSKSIKSLSSLMICCCYAGTCSWASTRARWWSKPWPRDWSSTGWRICAVRGIGSTLSSSSPATPRWPSRSAIWPDCAPSAYSAHSKPSPSYQVRIHSSRRRLPRFLFFF